MLKIITFVFMLKVALVGSGNLAFKLYTAMIEIEEVDLVGVYSRNEQTLADFSQVLTTTDPLILPAADITIIAVSDDAITEVSSKLLPKHGLLAHTSGAQPLEAIQSEKRGVLYPLQTFSRDRTVDFNKVPFCIEAESDSDYKRLEMLCESLTDRVEYVLSEDRKYLHLAAVFVNNFVNQLYQTAYEVLEGRDIPFDLLYPLIEETAAKVKGVVPSTVQTGPAMRNDKGVINKHLAIQNEDQQKIYKLLTQAIKQSQQHEL